ncbi:hypothetical protein FDK21_03560 [Cohaesibacter sp. CAU 1516]|uniref:hypothetical protein n=1 Tax=Cohaesibacter sp. CAU 1516 TaxID=2576038 RepID=UPI0010FE93B8|nr:hypothetical protein [Cohaesibacter sp. CAU 1516]TLP48748.1 hypothetical protein FDK21_03560 [Cohaesibacter sp. CAU 1516]
MNKTRMEIQSFPYHLQGPSVCLIGLLIALFGGLMLFMAWTEPDRFIGMPVGYPAGAFLYGALALVAFTAIFIMARAWAMQRHGERQIRFEEDRVLLPKNPFSNQIIAIPYRTIRSVNQQSASRAAMRFIVIKHAAGHTQIADFGFETKAAFEMVFETLRKRVG